MKDTHFLYSIATLAIGSLLAIFVSFATGTLPKSPLQEVRVSPTTLATASAPQNCECCDLEYLKTHGATHMMLTGKDPSRSFLHGDLSDAFLPVYPKQNVATATVKVWEIAYPPDIESDPKYLKTGFRDIDAVLELE